MIKFVINFSLSCVVRTMQKKRAAVPVRSNGCTVEAKKIFDRGEYGGVTAIAMVQGKI